MTKNKLSIAQVIGGGYNEFWNNKNFYRVVKGSRGSKKSKTTALNFIYRLMKYEWSNLLVVRRFSNTNKQSTYTDLKWATNQLGVAHLFKFNESLPEITYKPTGQKILFRGLDDPLKITSITVDVGILCWAWFEEAYQIENFDKFSTVVESIRGSLDEPEFFKQITVTFNPWSERHWLKPTFFDEDTRLKNVYSNTTTFRVNEWLDKVDVDRYEDLYRTNPRRARIVCDGEWGVAEGLVYDNFVVEDFDWFQIYKKTQFKVHGIDYGFTNDPTALISAVVDLDNKILWLYDEHYEKGMLSDDIYKMIVKKDLETAEIKSENDMRMIAELKNKGVKRIVPAVKGPHSIMPGIQYVQGFKIYIHPSCVHTIEEFNTYTFEQDNEGNWINKPIDKNNHALDALRYALSDLIFKSKKNDKNTLRKIKSMF
ncbi:PBSX family phage terminase large subunit [Staphylococcus pseudintermedius]|uniref:PBSX family phage terminase large subunit n=1 Tax=Staphylococcus pseudintermedius TaxID=283734 RepID=UPI00111D5AEE|nr:PBSX family phage terminase large subunit [Staphylococcus pseudintermedius]EGQ1310173.1 PBSX family phage terminase large subunit [Staphylococcus pseudintermedius]EGQ1725606.1 PBSX family phage terminase large subunit [Staphylococcus pseudintermedius]EGQ2757064.1 PBSX family phage terminase large subunit [Staphylococcus pseudintermedius]EGQ2980258.1 PBSX family phage terminase large subunit [Staphylococcus pseudintermedius]EGQ3293045.1 PBSX family phage terminase large subunit [Staphylococc